MHYQHSRYINKHISIICENENRITVVDGHTDNDSSFIQKKHFRANGLECGSLTITFHKSYGLKSNDDREHN